MESRGRDGSTDPSCCYEGRLSVSMHRSPGAGGRSALLRWGCVVAAKNNAQQPERAICVLVLAAGRSLVVRCFGEKNYCCSCWIWMMADS